MRDRYNLNTLPQGTSEDMLEYGNIEIDICEVLFKRTVPFHEAVTNGIVIITTI